MKDEILKSLNSNNGYIAYLRLRNKVIGSDVDQAKKFKEEIRNLVEIGNVEEREGFNNLVYKLISN